MLGDDVRGEDAVPDHYRCVVRTLVIGPEVTPNRPLSGAATD